MIYEAFDVVVVPFPFTDSDQVKKRPALIISSNNAFNKESNHSIMVMITSARNKSWPLDVLIKGLKESGLPNSSTIRMKFFTLDHRLIIKKIGRLADKDCKQFKKNFEKMFQDI